MNGTGITLLPIRIRIGRANAGDWETRTYTDSTFDEAVAALQGEHGTGDEAYHEATNVYVVAVYPDSFTEDIGRNRTVERYAGEPVFGEEVTVYGRSRRWSTASDCELSMGSMGSESTDGARLRLNLYDLALRIAEAANSWPRCAECVKQDERRAAREKAIRQENLARVAAHANMHEVAELVAHDHMAPHSHEVRSDHQGVPCECGHERHHGKVCKECQKQTPRGIHGTPARVRAAGIMS